MRYELVDGSGGPGTQRGGMGLRRVYRAEEDCRVRIDGSRFLSRSWGLQGGGAGRPRRLRLGPGAPPFDHGNVSLPAGEWLEIITPGGGGYGPAAIAIPTALAARDLARQAGIRPGHGKSRLHASDL